MRDALITSLADRPAGRPPVPYAPGHAGRPLLLAGTVVYTIVMDAKVLNYRIIIQPERYEDGSVVYAAHCPTLEVVDYGDSVEAVLNSIKDGIELAIESLAKQKKEIPVDHTNEQIITTAKVRYPSGFSGQFAV